MADTRPNIILITTDQQRGDCLGIEGHPVLQTPNIDYLARSGTHFRRGYSECPSCYPARRVLMSGQAPAVNGMVGMASAPAWNPPHTVAGELAKAGYQTEMVGKLHLFPHRKRFGFDHMRLSNATHTSGESPHDNDYTSWLMEGGAMPLEVGVAHGVDANGWVGRPHYLPEEKTHTFWCVDQALDFMDRRDPTMPFFLNVSFIDPHPPLTPPKFYYDRYMATDIPMPVVGDWAQSLHWREFKGPKRGLRTASPRVRLDEQTMRYTRAAYYGMINHIDDQIGRLLNSLQRRRLLGNTFILFTSDHGEMLGDHDLYRKTYAYEASARVPFVAFAPHDMGFPEEITTFAPVGLQDIMPTLLDVAGVPIPETCTGRSLLPLMRGDEAGWRDVLHGEHAGCYCKDDGVHFLTDGRYKYIWYSQTGNEQLFDLNEDPNELHDLARDNHPDVEQWRSRLAHELKDRPEGFSDGTQLFVGRPHEHLVPEQTLTTEAS